MAFNSLPGKYFPHIEPQEIKYNFFLDLEHGYCETAGSRIHLYADSQRWAVVFEKSGYQNRGTSADIELDYIGNCVEYLIESHNGRKYISNSSWIVLITPDEFQRIENKEETDMETFELIAPQTEAVKVRDQLVPFDRTHRNYEKLGIKMRDYENPQKLVAFEDLVRYLHETKPLLISAKEEEIQQFLPKDIPKIMTIEAFHFTSFYDKGNPPSQQETYRLIAKVLTTRDKTDWKPTLKPNNHWSNWESGNL